MSSVTALALLVLVPLCASYDFQSGWRETMDFECPRGSIISRIYSYFSSYKKDRKWMVDCAAIPDSSASSCFWSGNANGFTDELDFSCDSNKVITGIKSYFNKHRGDRRFNFQCCRFSGRDVGRCENTNYVNDFRQILSYTVPSGKAITGVTAHFDDHPSDRRFQFDVCDF